MAKNKADRPSGAVDADLVLAAERAEIAMLASRRLIEASRRYLAMAAQAVEAAGAGAGGVGLPGAAGGTSWGKGMARGEWQGDITD